MSRHAAALCILSGKPLASPGLCNTRLETPGPDVKNIQVGSAQAERARGAPPNPPA